MRELANMFPVFLAGMAMGAMLMAVLQRRAQQRKISNSPGGDLAEAILAEDRGKNRERRA